MPKEDTTRPTLIRIWAFASIPLATLTLRNIWFAALIVLALVFCAGIIARLTTFELTNLFLDKN